MLTVKLSNLHEASMKGLQDSHSQNPFGLSSIMQERNTGTTVLICSAAQGPALAMMDSP
jgi:hypothetical protein